MTTPSHGKRPDARDLRGIPARGILIGAVLALALNVCDTYATNAIQGSYLTLNFSTPPPCSSSSSSSWPAAPSVSSTGGWR